MAKFFYKMQNILDIKLKLETQAKNEFAIANAELAAEEEKLNDLAKRQASYEEKLKLLYQNELKINEINETANAVEVMKYHKNIQMVNVKNAKRKVEIARAKLQDAIQERKTHEKLKENAFEEFMAEVAAGESKEIDELVSYRHGQSSNEV